MVPLLHVLLLSNKTVTESSKVMAVEIGLESGDANVGGEGGSADGSTVGSVVGDVVTGYVVMHKF